MLLYFNPRSREGSDSFTERECHYSNTFQSTLPRRERLPCVRCVGTKGDFNPRSREGSDKACCDKFTRDPDFNPRSREGSDKSRSIIRIIFKISIHAPAKGATDEKRHFAYFHNISIHAPAKGATELPGKDCRLESQFQSTLPRRERQAITKIFLMIHQFQSTLPRRERHIVYPRWCVRCYFNPRSHEGSDTVKG